eukprot:UN13351
MVKTDTHMHKIKGKLLFEKKKIEEAEERKKARESKKRSKEVQAEKLKERAKEKKESIESVKKWRKQRQQGDFPRERRTGQTSTLKLKDSSNTRSRGLAFLLVTGLVVLLSEANKERTIGQRIPSLGMAAAKGP